MLTLICSAIISFVLVFFSFRLISLVKKKPSPLSYYFLGAIGISTVGQVTATLLFAVFLFLVKSTGLLYWADVLGRLSLLLSAAFTIQIPLSFYFPKSKKRILFSYAAAAFALIIFLYNLTLHYRPVVNSIGIIQIPSLVVGELAGIFLLMVWLSATIVFFIQFYKSKYKLVRSFLLGFGFLLTSIGGVVYQALTKTMSEYLFANLIIVLGFIVLFVALMLKEV